MPVPPEKLDSTPLTPPAIIRALRDLGALARSGAAGKELREGIVAAAAALFYADAVALWRVESRDRIWRVASATGLSRDYSEVAIPVPTSYSASDLLAEPIHIPDVRSWPLVDERRALYESEGLVSCLVLPLNIRGETTGTVACYYRTLKPAASELELDAAAAFAEIASIALSTERYDQLAEVSRDVAGSLDLQSILQRITDAATSLTGAQVGAFFYNAVSPEGESLVLFTISGVPRSHFEQFPMPRNTQVFAPTFTGSAIVRSPNILKDPRYGHNAPYFGMPAGHLPVVSYLAVPVKSHDGEVLGGLFFGHPAENVFGETEEKITEALAGHAGVALDNVRLYERLEKDRAALRREERRYRSLVLATPSRQAIIVYDREGLVSEDAPSWREITGQSPEEILGGGWLDAVHSDHRARVKEIWQKTITSRGIFDEELFLRQADGSYRWFADKTVPVFNEGIAVEEWIGTAVDVHDERVAREGQKFLAKANELFASSLDYRETLRNVTFLAVPRIADWCVVDMVDAGAETGRSRLAMAHSDPAKIALAEEFSRKYPPDPENDAFLRVLRTGASELIPHIPDELLVRSARSPEHLSMMRELGIMSYMIVPLRSRGEVIGTITFVASDRRFSERDLRHAEDLALRASIAIENASLYSAAQAANRAKDEFLATLSHELRTPMTAVLGWARMLKLGLNEEESKLAIDAIEQSAGVQAQLIEDVLDVSRIMSGKLTFDPHPVDLRTVTEAAITTIHPAAAAKGINVVTSFPDLLPHVSGDEGRLQQVIWNLMSNAIKFTPRNGSVVVRLSTEGSLVRLSVRDTGEGIEREFLPYVFEPFRQADNSTTRPHGGIGLGLAIVRSLVELHGGRIRAESAGRGKGATFILDLPVLETTDAIVGNLEHPRELPHVVTGQLASLAGVSVLVIDDQSLTREVIAAILARAGGVVQRAASAAEGLLLLRDSPPRVVVCDIAMPGRDGYSFLRDLRSEPAPLSRTPVVALTAFGRPEDRRRALDAGFDAYLKKPVDPGELAEMVRRLSSDEDRSTAS